MENHYDYLIVGSGLFGATFAHLAHKQGKKCLVIDKRSHLGGNIYCENIEGINVHKYGAHIFHTSNKSDFQRNLHSFSFLLLQANLQSVCYNHQQGQAINFFLYHKLWIIQLFYGRGHKLLYLLTRKNILQGKHRHIMSHQHTSLTTGIAPYHLSRGIFGNQLRIICVQLFQL